MPEKLLNEITEWRKQISWRYETLLSHATWCYDVTVRQWRTGRLGCRRYPKQTGKLSYRKDDRAMPLYMGVLKIFDSPWVRPRLLFPKFLMVFCSDRSYECATKFEVRSFTRSWDNGGLMGVLKNLGQFNGPCSFKSAHLYTIRRRCCAWCS